MNQRSQQYHYERKNNNQCFPGLVDGSVLQMINLGLFLILCNISIEKTPSKYGSVLVLHVKACQICFVFMLLM